MIRKEGTGAKGVGLVRLDAEPEQQDGVDLGMRADQIEDRGDRVTGLAAGQIDRILAAPAYRYQGVDRRPHLRRQGKETESSGGARVGGLCG